MEAERRGDDSIEAYRRALHCARTVHVPTPEQAALLRLPLYEERKCWLAWQTTVVDAYKTRASLPLPAELCAFFTSSSDTLAEFPSRCRYVIARKQRVGAFASLQIQHSATTLERAKLEWRDGYDSGDWERDATRLNFESTVISFPFSRMEDSFLKQWPGALSTWMEETLREFVEQSCISRAKNATMTKVWQAAEQAARAEVATASTDDQALEGLLALPGNEVQCRAAQVIADEEQKA